MDHFAITGKKGQKLIISTLTYEVNSPAEVLVRVLDSKGAQVAASNPATPTNRFEFTPSADGDFVIACEHQNFLYGAERGGTTFSVVPSRRRTSTSRSRSIVAKPQPVAGPVYSPPSRDSTATVGRWN